MDVLNSGSHEILFGSEAYPALNQLISESQFSKVFVLTDSNTENLLSPALSGICTPGIPLGGAGISCGRDF